MTIQKRKSTHGNGIVGTVDRVCVKVQGVTIAASSLLTVMADSTTPTIELTEATNPV